MFVSSNMWLIASPFRCRRSVPHQVPCRARSSGRHSSRQLAFQRCPALAACPRSGSGSSSEYQALLAQYGVQGRDMWECRESGQ